MATTLKLAMPKIDEHTEQPEHSNVYCYLEHKVVQLFWKKISQFLIGLNMTSTR